MRIVAALAEVLRLDVADVQEPVAAHAEIDERRLDARLQVDHDSLVDVSYVIVLSGPFDVQLFKDSVLNDRNPAFFRLGDVDQHFLFHVVAFLFGNTDQYAFAANRGRGICESLWLSCANLHGGAAEMNALLLDIGQFQTRPARRAGRRCRGVHAEPHRQHALAQRQLDDERTQVDRRTPMRTLDRPRRGGQQTLDPLGQGRLGRTRGSGLRRMRFGRCAFVLPSGRTSIARKTSPGGACGVKRRSNSSAV